MADKPIDSNLDAAQKLLETLKKAEEVNEEMVKQAKALADLYENVYNNTKKDLDMRLLAFEQRKEQHRLEIRLLESKHSLDEEGVKKQQEEIKNAEKLIAILDIKIKQVKQIHATIEESVTAAEGLGTAIGSAMKLEFSKNFVGGLQKLVKSVQGAEASLFAFGEALLTSVSTSFINNVAGLVVEIFNVEAGFRRATGANAAFARSVTYSYEEVKKYGVITQEASAAAQTLYTSYTDFTMLNEDTRKGLQNTVAVLNKYGIAMDDLAVGTQIGTKMFGISANSIEKTHREIATYAMEIGVAPSQMAQQFAAAGPSLAKFGNDGVRVFKELQRTSKITGMEMDKLLQITNKFDTFEGAATQAGKLNAALGGNFVNAMDLMMQTDPQERFDMIRGAIESAGLSFDTMSYYQRNFYKDALGLESVGDLALVLSGNQDKLAGSTRKSAKEYEELANQALEMQSLQEQFNALIAEATPVIKPFVKGLQDIMIWLRENRGVLNAVIGVIVLLKGVILAWAFVKKASTAATKISTAAKWLHSIAIGAETAATKIQTDAVKENNAATGKLSSTSKSSIGTIAALGVAVAGIGIGFGAAAFGAASLIESLEKVKDNAGTVYAGLAIFGTIFAVIAIGIISIGAASSAAWAPILAVGAAATLIGVGFLAASHGAAVLINSLSSLKDMGTTLVNLGFSMTFLATSLLLLASPASLVGLVYVNQYAKALKSLGEAIRPLNDLLLSLREMGTLSLESSVGEVQKLVGEVQKLDIARAQAFTKAIDAVTTQSIIASRQEPRRQTPAWAAPEGAGKNTAIQLNLDSGETRRFWNDLVETGMAKAVGAG